jgi:hypothetical protein
MFRNIGRWMGEGKYMQWPAMPSFNTAPGIGGLEESKGNSTSTKDKWHGIQGS